MCYCNATGQRRCSQSARISDNVEHFVTQLEHKLQPIHRFQDSVEESHYSSNLKSLRATDA